MAESRNDPTSSEMRHDWLTDRWVIMAPQRSARPLDFVRQPTQLAGSERCPFCHGHESQTPDAVASYLHPSQQAVAAWHVRVVPNKFPAVTQTVKLVASGLSALGQLQPALNLEDSHWEGSSRYLAEDQEEVSSVCDQLTSAGELFRRRSLNGGHEVIIEGPDHVQSLSHLDQETIALVFQAYRDRLRYWLGEQSLAYAVVFKNVGLEAGASLVHSHSQLIATDLVPTDVVRSVQRMQQFYQREFACVICRTVQDELDQRLRIVEETEDLVAYCPFASRLPSLITVTSKSHLDRFESLSSDRLSQLSSLMYRLIRRLEYRFPSTAYNYIVHTAPNQLSNDCSYHWRIELFPRISTQAGFEWGSECFINPLLPETAAYQLRTAKS